MFTNTLSSQRYRRVASSAGYAFFIGAVALPAALASQEGSLSIQEAPGQEGQFGQGEGYDGSDRGGLAPNDWEGIRKAHNVFRHRALKTTEGLWASNPGQGWGIDFDGQGFLVQPVEGSWSWGLQLESFGFEGCKNWVPKRGWVVANENRVSYHWGECIEEAGLDGIHLEEWYINDRRGLEHGYTLEVRPEALSGSSALLEFDLAVRGDLHAEILSDGKGVRFVNGQGESVLTYAGLRVFDSLNHDQPAQFSGGGKHIRITMDESSAQYPLTIDPVAQEAYLKASNTGLGDQFGMRVATSGDRVVIGSPREESSATGINGDGALNDSDRSGAAYIFREVGGVWMQEAYLKASNTDSDDAFGVSVAMDGDRVVVGAHFEDSNATGVNGNGANNDFQNAGAAYVFREVGGTWAQEAYLKASNAGLLDKFGSSVAISGDRVVVGAVGEASGATGVDGDETLNSTQSSGAVYVFREAGGTWSQEAYLKASNTDSGDNFGQSVSISGDRVVVGASQERSGAIGVNGDEARNDVIQAGAAYVFREVAGVWAQEAYLKASNTDVGDGFGSSVGISGERVVAGANGEDSSATGVNGNDALNDLGTSGAAYVFREVGGVWAQEAYLKASNPNVLYQFGTAVAISGGRVVVGSFAERSSAIGIDGNQFLFDANVAGAAYLFQESGGMWRQEAYLKASNTGSGDQFGRFVAISGDRVVIGAPMEDSSAIGANGDGTLDDASSSGAAYIYDLEAKVASFCGTDLINSSGFPGVMSVSGSLVISDNALTLHADGMPVGELGLFINSRGRDFVWMPGGFNGSLCLGGAQAIGRILESAQLSDASGAISFLVDLTRLPSPAGPVSVVAGETWHFQCLHRNGIGMANFTNGVSVLFE